MRGIGSLSGSVAPGARGGGRVAARGFRLAEGAAGAARGVGGAAGVAAIGAGLLALQAEDGPEARDATARRRADALLEELRRLQLGLLGGGLDRGRLRRLAALRLGEEGADPALREVVQSLVLRASVELARHGWDASAMEE